jgi:hypothetical protein
MTIVQSERCGMQSGMGDFLGGGKIELGGAPEAGFARELKEDCDYVLTAS